MMFPRGAVTASMSSLRATREGGCNRLATEGPAPSPRSTPAVGVVDGDVSVFGGMHDDLVTGVFTVYDDLYRLDTAGRTWERPDPEGRRPAGRVFACSVTDEREGRIYVLRGCRYGGFGHSDKADGSLHGSRCTATCGRTTWPAVAGSRSSRGKAVRPPGPARTCGSTATGQGLGTQLLLGALERIVAAADRAGGRVIVVDAIDDAAHRSYSHHGVRAIEHSNRLVMKLATATAILG